MDVFGTIILYTSEKNDSHLCDFVVQYIVRKNRKYFRNGEKMFFYRVYAKIDLDAIEHNIDVIRKKSIKDKKLMLVVKADAYGHGSAELSHELEDKADYFGVAEINEALELRKNGIKKPILILGFTPSQHFTVALKNDITLTMFQPNMIKLLSDEAVLLGKKAKVHFAVDTGMSRIGWDVSEKSADEAAEAARLPGIEAEGIFSHLAAADEEDKSFALQQISEYEKFLDMLKKRGVEPLIKHIDNSAGILELENSYDMVRAGIIIYGLYPSETTKENVKNKFRLRPAMELITHISHIKTLPKGKCISYGATFVTEKETRVATLLVGYADGYPRALSGKGEVLIHGKRCPILGRVCMDQMMLDVTDVPEAAIGDEAVLVGRSGKEFISAEQVSNAAYSFNYEFVCGISRRVPRVYYKNGEPCKTVLHIDV